jgi:Leucine rich repeat
LNCDFETSNWTAVGPVYYCKVERPLFIVSSLDTEVLSVEGTHQENMTSVEVSGFYSFNSFVKFFPSKLNQHFPNLVAIWINYGRIKEIHQSDLKPFTQLVRLDLGENDIRALEEGLFDFNPDLKFVGFVKNKICKIDANVFDRLVNLAYLELSNNDCFNVGASDSTSEVKNVIRQLKNKMKVEIEPKLLKDSGNLDEFPFRIFKNFDRTLTIRPSTSTAKDGEDSRQILVQNSKAVQVGPISSTIESVILSDDGEQATVNIDEDLLEDSSGSGQDAEDQNIEQAIGIHYMKSQISELESSLSTFSSGIPELPEKIDVLEKLQNLSKKLDDFLLKHGLEMRKVQKIYVKCSRCGARRGNIGAKNFWLRS